MPNQYYSVLAVPLDCQLPYRLFILLDPAFVDRTETIESMFRALHSQFRAASGKCPSSWPSVESAMAYLSRYPPWNKFDAENREIMAVRTLSVVL